MKKSSKYKILVVDDQKIVRDGIKNIIYHFSPECVIFEAKNGVEAVQMTKEERFDIVLMDLSMPVMDGYEASKILLSQNKDTKILIISMQTSRSEIEKIRLIGVSGFLPKDKVSLDLLYVIENIINGGTTFPST